MFSSIIEYNSIGFCPVEFENNCHTRGSGMLLNNFLVIYLLEMEISNHNHHIDHADVYWDGHEKIKCVGLSIRRVVVVIPALNPGKELIALVHQLRDQGFERFIIVNDGSDTSYDEAFEQVAGSPAVTVLKHMRNHGKGRALKTAFNYFLTHCNSYYGVVTVDADGQHSPNDIRNVAEILLKTPRTLVLGTRSFAREIPLRSKMGNVLTRYIFRFMLGKSVS